MTNFYSTALVEPNWASRLGASCLPSVGFLGTGVPAAGPSAAAAPALPRVRGKVSVLVPQAQKVAVPAAGGQTSDGQTHEGDARPPRKPPRTRGRRPGAGGRQPALPLESNGEALALDEDDDASAEAAG